MWPSLNLDADPGLDEALEEEDRGEHRSAVAAAAPAIPIRGTRTTFRRR
jgi:hypothetical protein